MASLRQSSRQRAKRSADKRRGLSLHILPTSATMIGVCVTVISLVRLFEVSGGVGTIIDRAIAADTLVFLAAALLSYMAMRSERNAQRLETYADITFLVALGVLAVMAFLFAWEIGYASS